MRYYQKLLIALALTIGSTIVVFCFSSQGANLSYGLSGHTLSVLEFCGVSIDEYYLRKLAHIFIYFLLGASSCGLMILFVRKSCWYHYAISIVVSVMFSYVCACMDEWNQSFVAGRTGLYTDVYYDAIGFVLGSVLVASVVIYNRRSCRV